jgi:hypothetical protein
MKSLLSQWVGKTTAYKIFIAVGAWKARGVTSFPHQAKGHCDADQGNDVNSLAKLIPIAIPASN